ncbi:MAG: CDP-alcohol phosphatidyltransferase family protein [Candidatus Marinimicrobia bacterium]|nr:CDP-alcohol phosphatidyltransferase family protein [Candidatus Neomarinimicrobiota bacterium]
MTFIHIYKDIAQFKKSFDIITNKFHYPIAIFLCTLISKSKATPNFITFISIVFELSAISLICINFSLYKYFIVILFQLGWIFDLMDGMLARYKKQGSYHPTNPSIKGYYLDAVSDHVLKFMAIGALAYQLSSTFSWGWKLSLLFIVIHAITQTEYTIRNLILVKTQQDKPELSRRTGSIVESTVLLFNNIYLFYIIFLPIDRIDLLFICFGIGEIILFIKRSLKFWVSVN